MSSVTGANYDGGLSRLLATIPSAQNRAVLERYLCERQALGIKPGTLYNDAHYVRDLCVFLGARPLEGLTRDDVAGFTASLSRERSYGNSKRRRVVTLNPSTLNQRKVILRAFVKWFRGTPGRDYPPEVAWLKLTPLKDTLPQDRMPTADDVARLLQAVPATVPRDEPWQLQQGRAVLAVLYECGPRASELCSLNVGSVEFDEFGARLHMPAGAENLKTGARIMRAVDSEPFLRDLLRAHSRAGDPKAPLFLALGDKRAGQRLTPQALRAFVGRVVRKAGLGKDVYPHAFRHAAVTEAARLGMTEPEMKAMFGWSKNSDMPSRYNHASGKDYEDRLLEMKGRKPKEATRKSPLLPRSCRKCATLNEPTAMWCGKCKAPLGLAAEREIEKDRLKAQLTDILLEALAAGSDEAKLDKPASALLDLLKQAGAA